jgi:glutaminase
MNFAAELKKVYEACFPHRGEGVVASYIPELAGVDPRHFGLSLHAMNGQAYSIGDSQKPFSIQSISKVLTLAMVLPRAPELLKRVHVEPSGTPFNSLVQLEYENGIPRNPFINAGALVVTDMLIELESDPKKALLEFVRGLTGDDSIGYNERVARSEILTANRNRALAHFMKAFGNLRADVEAVLDVYCYHCALEMTLEQVVETFAFLCRGGRSRGREVLSPTLVKRINALMLTCGFYDEAGEFAFRIGLPGKSGVGGGIVTVLPGHFVLASYSPGLNAKGNSSLGMRALELFAANTGLSLF